MGYGVNDGIRQKFTQKERDIETGLDYFGARYYSSVQGRFTSADKPFKDQFQANPQSWDSYSYVRNSPCNNMDVKGRCSSPSGLKPGQVGICVEAFIATKKAAKHGQTGYGDGRTFSGDDASLSARVRVDIIANRTPGNSKSFDITQHSTPGVTVADNPAAGFGIPGLPNGPTLVALGRADTKLNGESQGADGTSKITSPIQSDGMVNFNVATIGTNGIDAALGTNIMGQIKIDLNLTVNSNTGQVGIGDGSSATGYPSIAVYRYSYEGKNIVTKMITEIPEGSNDELDKPMKRIEHVKPQ